MAIEVVAEILSNQRLSRDYNVVGFAAPDIARLARPGQFLMVKPSTGGDPLLRRPFSLFEILRGRDGAIQGVSILNKRVGVGTGLLYEARVGDRLSIVGPLGRPWTLPAGGDAWFVAGGVGLAPFVTLAEACQAAGVPMRLFYGGRSASDLYYAALFAGLGATLDLTTDDGTHGERGRVTAPLARALEARGGAPVTLYSCGPTPMMRAVADLGAAHGVPTFVSLEQVMGCGMGGCYSCVVPVGDATSPHFVRSCLEGPVFDASRLVWDRLVH